MLNSSSSRSQLPGGLVSSSKQQLRYCWVAPHLKALTLICLWKLAAIACASALVSVTSSGVSTLKKPHRLKRTTKHWEKECTRPVASKSCAESHLASQHGCCAEILVTTRWVNQTVRSLPCNRACTRPPMPPPSLPGDKDKVKAPQRPIRHAKFATRGTHMAPCGPNVLQPLHAQAGSGTGSRAHSYRARCIKMHQAAICRNMTLGDSIAVPNLLVRARLMSSKHV